MQTEWAATWDATAAGFGRAAEYLTENRADFDAEIDQVGLAVFYLQRHRVELVLKGLLHALGKAVPSTHALDRLWRACHEAVCEVDPTIWGGLPRGCPDLIDALTKTDETSMVFRYPVDKKGEPSDRPPYVNLAALNQHVEDFYWSVFGIADYLAEVGAAADEHPESAEY